MEGYQGGEGTEHLCHDKRLRERGLLSLEKGSSGGSHPRPSSPAGRGREDGARLHPVEPSARTRGCQTSGALLHCKRRSTATGTREVAVSPPGDLQTHLDVSRHQLWWSCWSRAGPDGPRGPFHHQPSCASTAHRDALCLAQNGHSQTGFSCLLLGASLWDRTASYDPQLFQQR